MYCTEFGEWRTKCFITARINLKKNTVNKMNAKRNADKTEGATRTSYELGVKNDSALSFFPVFNLFFSIYEVVKRFHTKYI
jgi:hypothetical protein